MRELKQNTYFCVGFSATIIFDISLAAKRLSGNSERFFYLHRFFPCSNQYPKAEGLNSNSSH